MKNRLFQLTALTLTLLTACSMTLAQDVTPPPGALQQVQPTHAPVFPAEMPDLQNGASIYTEKCAACHGETGLGDGVMRAQLVDQGVDIPALGLPGTVRKAAPADWFLAVTLGNIENLMPSFSSLSDQERWDVVAYAMSLSLTPHQIAQGETLYTEACANCHKDQPEATGLSRLSQRSMDALDSVILNGIAGSQMPGFPGYSVEERGALAAYLRFSTFGAIPPTPALASSSVTPGASLNAPPSPEGTPQDGDLPAESDLGEGRQATPEATQTPDGYGSVRGKVINGSGGDLPVGLSVTLRGFDHAKDTGADPEEVVNQGVITGTDATFRFDNIEMPAGRIFFVEVDYQGIPFQSALTFTDTGVTELVLPDVAVYESTTQTGGLVVDELFVFSEFNSDGTVRIFEQFYITNQGDQAVTVETDGSSIPFLPVPEGVSGLAFQATQDSLPLLPLENGFAMPPSSERYGIIAFFTLPYEKKLDLALPFALPVSSMSVVVPEGIKALSDQLSDGGVKEMQPGARFQVYTASALQSGQSLEMTLSGKVKSDSSAGSANGNQSLLIGIGAFGLVLIFAGVWMYIRDRNKVEDEIAEGNEDEFESAEEIMDAIIALDDLHRAGKIPDAPYQERRAELKERLKE